MAVHNYLYMRRLILPFLILLLIPFVLASTAISPGCYPSDCKAINLTKGDMVTTSFRIFNTGSEKANYSIYLENDITKFAKQYPEKFSLEPRKSGDCIPENGCQEVKLVFNLTDVPAGNYSGNFVAQTVSDGAGSLAIIQEIVGRVSIQVNLPPTWYNTLWTWSSNIASKVWSYIKSVYWRNSYWINWGILIIAILLAYLIGLGVRRRYKKDWWEINILKINNHNILVLISYGSEKILLAKFANREYTIVDFMKEALKKNRPPVGIVMNKTADVEERFEILLENNGVKLFHLPEGDIDVELLEELISNNIDVEGVAKLSKFQQHLNSLVQTINEKQVVELILRKKSKREAIIKRHERR